MHAEPNSELEVLDYRPRSFPRNDVLFFFFSFLFFFGKRFILGNVATLRDYRPLNAKWQEKISPI